MSSMESVGGILDRKMIKRPLFKAAEVCAFVRAVWSDPVTTCSLKGGVLTLGVANHALAHTTSLKGDELLGLVGEQFGSQMVRRVRIVVRSKSQNECG